MIEPTVIRYEATEITANAFDDTAVLVMQTALDGRVAVHMQRDVLVALAAEIQLALAEEQPSVDKG
jgi:hypothetical protein